MLYVLGWGVIILIVGLDDLKGVQFVLIQLLVKGGPLQAAIQQIAVSEDADKPGALQRMFRETTEATLQAEPEWVYGHAEQVNGRNARMKALLTQRALLARAAFTSATTLNQQDGLNTGARRTPSTAGAEPGAPLYLAVTLGALVRRQPVRVQPTFRAADLKALLTQLRDTAQDDLYQVQVVWSPDVPGEFLTEDHSGFQFH